MPDFSVHQYGTDVYGRPLYMTVFMHDWFDNYCDELGWRPRVLQGCFMERFPGGGAGASEGAHDKGKCLDLETEGRSVSQIDLMVKVARDNGAGAYRRDRTPSHGEMTPHMHLTLGADFPGSPMANILWLSYVSGGDGLAIQPPQPDYEDRPDPLVLVPPEVDMTPAQQAQLDRIEALLNKMPEAILDEEKVDKEKKVSVRQAINQIRNKVKP